MYRIDSIMMFEGAGDTWLLEARFLGFHGRRVYATLLHFQATGSTEIRPQLGRPTTADVVRPGSVTISFGARPGTIRRQIAATLNALGWGPEVPSSGPPGQRFAPRYTE
jgi:hypothetical protein